VGARSIWEARVRQEGIKIERIHQQLLLGTFWDGKNQSEAVEKSSKRSKFYFLNQKELVNYLEFHFQI